MPSEIQLTEATYLDTSKRRKLNIRGIELDEGFLSELVIDYLKRNHGQSRPTITTAFDIYMSQSLSAHRRKFRADAHHYFGLFIKHFGDLPLDELKHAHITAYRDIQLARRLHPRNPVSYTHLTLPTKRIV